MSEEHMGFCFRPSSNNFKHPFSDYEAALLRELQYIIFPSVWCFCLLLFLALGVLLSSRQGHLGLLPEWLQLIQNFTMCSSNDSFPSALPHACQY